MKMVAGGADFRSLGDFGSLHRRCVLFSDQTTEKDMEMQMQFPFHIL